MKKLGIVAVTLMLAALFQTAVCFAGTLTIVNSYPHDGGTGLQPVNCAVKIYFNQDVAGAQFLETNKACFTITDSENKVQPVTVLHDSKDRTMVLVVLNNTLASDTDYKLTISGDFTATSGDTLVTDRVIHFKTRDLKKDNSTSMIMMVVMFVGILFFSTRQMKKQAKKDAAEGKKEEKVNPYKVSKETGKSVAEIVEKSEKMKRKKEKAEAKLGEERRSG